ncbi:hypothetical protein KKH27_13380 [bacterium]|nr:hypothetical protein [bacterium]MBU1984458.1 hypothetical protein [bacterium]
MPRFHSILLLLFLLSAVHPAFCQWDRHFPIAQDTFAHGFPQILVDDSLRLHVFDVRQHNQPDGVRSSLYYQQFDHWGNPLTTPMNVFQDDHWQDYGAGVLLDRNNQIHVVWCRFYHIIPPTGNRVYYTSLSLEGQVLTDPFVMVTPYRNYAVQAGINLVQSEDGRIWVALDHFFAVLDEAGNVLQPFQPVYDPFYAINQPILASAPNNQVWAAVRFIDSTQNVSVVRVDTSVLVMEEVSGAYPDWLQMTPEAFFIDSTGAFHYVLYREDAGLVYQRDGRDGSPPTRR